MTGKKHRLGMRWGATATAYLGQANEFPTHTATSKNKCVASSAPFFMQHGQNTKQNSYREFITIIIYYDKVVRIV